MQLYVILEGQKVVEACPVEIIGAKPVSATPQQIEQIMRERYDATSDGNQIISTTQGEDYVKLNEYRSSQEAERQKELAKA